MGVSVTRIVKFIRKGNGVIIAQSPTVWSYTETQWKNYYCTNDRALTWKPITNVSDFTVGDTIVINGVVSDKDNITISLYAKVNSVDVANQAIVAQSQNYIISGKDGKDAVSIYVDPSTILHKKAADKAIYEVTFKVSKGETVVEYGQDAGQFISSTPRTALPTGLTWRCKIEDTYITHCFIIAENAIINTNVKFNITYNNVAYERTIAIKTVADGQQGGKGDRGPALRGPQAWSDCAVGYVFQSGADDEEYKDIVLYNNNYYSCTKSHAKTVRNAPLSTISNSSGLWKLADKLEIIATKILLAQYALVKNLGVEVIDMKDSAGNIIFQAKDGDVVCNSGTFKKVNVEGNFKSKNDTTWNEIEVNADKGYLVMRGPSLVNDDDHDLPYGNASIRDLFKVQFETDPDTLARVATMYLYGLGRTLRIDPIEGLSYTDYDGKNYYKTWPELLGE